MEEKKSYGCFVLAPYPSRKIRPGFSLSEKRRCERIEVFSSISSSRPIYISNGFRTEESGRERRGSPRWILIGNSAELRFFSALGWGRRSRGIGERDNGVRKGVFSRGWLSRGRPTSNDGGRIVDGAAVCRGKVRWRRGRRREGSFVASRDAEEEAEDTEGEGSVGRFPLSAVNTAHGRRYNWRRPRMPDNSNDNEDKRNRAGEENNGGGRSVQSTEERASELLELTEFNLRLSHFSGLSSSASTSLRNTWTAIPAP